jgi:hypothetical protein
MGGGAIENVGDTPLSEDSNTDTDLLLFIMLVGK